MRLPEYGWATPSSYSKSGRVARLSTQSEGIRVYKPIVSHCKTHSMLYQPHSGQLLQDR